MCIIMVCHKRLPTEAELLLAEEHNSDGAGYCIISPSGKEVIWEKGLTAKALYKRILDGTITLPAAIHMRFATAGGSSPSLCHPFPVTQEVSVALSGGAPAVFMHNGHWTQWKTVADGLFNLTPGGPMSDSRFLAWLLAHGADINNMAAAAGKLLYFSVNGWKTFGQGWELHKDMWVSNTYSLEKPKIYMRGLGNYHGHGYGWRDLDDAPDDLPVKSTVKSPSAPRKVDAALEDEKLLPAHYKSKSALREMRKAYKAEKRAAKREASSGAATEQKERIIIDAKGGACAVCWWEGSSHRMPLVDKWNARCIKHKDVVDFIGKQRPAALELD